MFGVANGFNISILETVLEQEFTAPVNTAAHNLDTDRIMRRFLRTEWMTAWHDKSPASSLPLVRLITIDNLADWWWLSVHKKHHLIQNTQCCAQALDYGVQINSQGILWQTSTFNHQEIRPVTPQKIMAYSMVIDFNCTIDRIWRGESYYKGCNPVLTTQSFS